MKSPKSRTPSPETERALATLLAAVAAAAVVTCASVRPNPAPAPPGSRSGSATETSSDPLTRPAAAPEPGAAPVTGSAPPPAREGSAPPPGQPRATGGGGRLARLHGDLAALESGSRAAPVRILWLGDSHTAADFWTDAVRRPLQRRFGIGGPGFVYLGVKHYRHSGARLEREGRVRVLPRRPSFWERQDDGVFGIGGMRTELLDDAARLTVELRSGAVVAEARWELVYRMPSPGARFTVRRGDGEPILVTGRSEQERGFLSRVTWETEAEVRVEVTAAVGEPQLFGLIIESSTPGVVVDTLGINGARIGTPLAWQEEAWVEEMAHRSPSLVVIAYGTNEVGDAVAPSRYATGYEALLARVRRAEPRVDCLVVGPTDRAGPDWATHPRVPEIEAVQRAAAEQLGCAFFSAFDAMGGEGGISRWAAESPPLATKDRVHLTPKGYEKLGEATVEAILAGYGRVEH